MKFTAKILTFSAIFVQAAEAVPASVGKDFAVSCSGTANWLNNMVGNGKPRIDTTGVQIFVVRPNSRIVHRALRPRQEFDPICRSDKVKNKASISPGLVTLSSRDFSDDGTATSCSFEIDRKNGSAQYQMEFKFKNGRTYGWDWQMKCTPTKIPIFDTSRNKL